MRFSRTLCAALLLVIPLVALGDTPVGGPGAAAPITGLATDPRAIIGQIFNFSLAIAGLLAFFMIVWGGVKYAANPGNSSALEDAKDQIIQALLGLLLLVGAVLVLDTINPQINLSGFGNITALPSAATSTCSTPCTAPGTFCGPGGMCVGCGGTCGPGQACLLDSGSGAPRCVPCPADTLASCQKEGKKCVVASGNGTSFVCAADCGGEANLNGTCPEGSVCNQDANSIWSCVPDGADNANAEGS